MDFSFAGMALVAGLGLSSGISSVISVCVPAQAGIAGGILARLRRARGLFWVKDLPLEAALSTGLLRRGSFAAKAGQAVERASAEINDRVVVLSNAFASYFTGLGLDPSKIAVVPDWVVDEDVTNERRRALEVRRELGFRPDQFVLVHAGNLGEKQGMDALVRWLAPLGDLVGLVVVGGGSAEPRVRRAAVESGANVHFLDFQPRGTLLQLLCSADALLLSQLPSVTTSVVPSKLLTYMATGRPVFAVVNPISSAGGLVIQSGGGVVVDPADSSKVADGLRAFARTPKHDLDAMGEAGRRFITDRFGKASVMRRWLQLLEAPNAS